VLSIHIEKHISIKTQAKNTIIGFIHAFIAFEQNIVYECSGENTIEVKSNTINVNKRSELVEFLILKYSLDINEFLLY
jgi:hypothetical protein